LRGLIFRAYLNFIKDNFGYEELDEILQKDDYPNKGGFSSAGNYKSKYLISLVTHTTHLYGNSKEKVIEAFGKYAFNFLLDRFKKSYKGSTSPLHTNNAYNFLEKLNVIHFDELRKLYPDADFPKFDINRVDSEHIIIEYSSHRNLPYLVYGLIKGCLKYYNDNSTVTMKKTTEYKIIKNIKCPIYKFEVSSIG